MMLNFPPSPVFFYDVKVEDIWSTTANIWIDLPVSNRLDVYGGGGIGMGGFELQVSDGIVEGSSRLNGGTASAAATVTEVSQVLTSGYSIRSPKVS